MPRAQDLYRDLRTAVDMCHRDGSLKRAVAANPEKFIHRDEHLVHVSGGTKVLSYMSAGGKGAPLWRKGCGPVGMEGSTRIRRNTGVQARHVVGRGNEHLLDKSDGLAW